MLHVQVRHVSWSFETMRGSPRKQAPGPVITGWICLLNHFPCHFYDIPDFLLLFSRSQRVLRALLILITTNNYFIINSKFYILKLKEKTTSYKTIFNSLLCFGLWCFCFICKILNVFKCFVSFDLLLYIIHVVSNVFSSVTLIWLSLCSLCIDRSVPITLHRTQTTSCCHAETLKLQNTCTVY